MGYNLPKVKNYSYIEDGTIVVLTHLVFIETEKNPETRCQMKFSLTRPLYEKGYDRDYVINLLKVIDWALVLPRTFRARI